jgi:hypothetical protein
MDAIDGVWPRRVVFDVDGGDVDAGTAAQQPIGEINLFRPLQDH